MKLPPCDICHKAVTIDTAGAWVNYGDISRREAAVEQWDRAHPELSTEFPDGYPDALPWVWGHLSCGERDANDYWFEAAEMETPTDALSQTLHMIEKNWIEQTDWGTLVRRLHDVH
jgi:hypothetical protein